MFLTIHIFVDSDPIVPATKSLYINESDEYKLSKVVMLSRHNIRSPLSNDSILSCVTPCNLRNWTSFSSELSLQGRELEFKFGQFFREYFLSKGLINDDIFISKDKIRIYSNSTQRTIVSAEMFAKGLFPKRMLKLSITTSLKIVFLNRMSIKIHV